MGDRNTMVKTRRIPRSLIYEQLAGSENETGAEDSRPSLGNPGWRLQNVPRPTKKGVVIVDDDASIRMIFEKLLVMNGFDVMSSMSDGEEIVRFLEEIVPPDVILLDERMPRMNGVDACKIIHAKHPTISIVFVSADESARARAMQAGARAFLKKPITLSELILTLNSI